MQHTVFQGRSHARSPPVPQANSREAPSTASNSAAAPTANERLTPHWANLSKRIQLPQQIRKCDKSASTNHHETHYLIRGTATEEYALSLKDSFLKTTFPYSLQARQRQNARHPSLPGMLACHSVTMFTAQSFSNRTRKWST